MATFIFYFLCLLLPFTTLGSETGQQSEAPCPIDNSTTSVNSTLLNTINSEESIMKAIFEMKSYFLLNVVFELKGIEMNFFFTQVKRSRKKIGTFTI